MIGCGQGSLSMLKFGLFDQLTCFENNLKMKNWDISNACEKTSEGFYLILFYFSILFLCYFIYFNKSPKFPVKKKEENKIKFILTSSVPIQWGIATIQWSIYSWYDH